MGVTEKEVKVSEKHVWVGVEDQHVYLGLTNYIQKELGPVISINSDLESRPSIINEDPYNEGWLVEVRLTDVTELDALMDMDEYYHFVFSFKSYVDLRCLRSFPLLSTKE